MKLIISFMVGGLLAIAFFLYFHECPIITVEKIIYKEAPKPKPKKKKPYRWILARVTAYKPASYGIGSKNHRMKDVRNNRGCAVPSRTLKDGTRIVIPKYGISRIVDDRIPRRSWMKHKRIARRKGKPIDLTLDLRYNDIKRSDLIKKDLGYQAVKVYE